MKHMYWLCFICVYYQNSWCSYEGKSNQLGMPNSVQFLYQSQSNRYFEESINQILIDEREQRKLLAFEEEFIKNIHFRFYRVISWKCEVGNNHLDLSADAQDLRVESNDDLDKLYQELPSRSTSPGRVISLEQIWQHQPEEKQLQRLDLEHEL